jgi:molybdate transport system substrate-binding protein
VRRTVLTAVVVSGSLLVAVALLGTERLPAVHLDLLCGAGLIKPMDELCRAFEAAHGMPVRVSYGGSGMLLGAFAAGQPCDVFMPGAARHVEDAARRGWIVADTRRDIVYHVPAVAVPADNPAGIAGLADLARPGVRVALGDPQACAVGGVAEKILQQNGLAEAVLPNVRVWTATVNELLVYLTVGQADAAVVWQDLLRWPEAAGKLKAIPIAPEQNVIRTIAAARATQAARPELADRFVQFLASDEGVAIWQKWGFDPCVE